MAGPAIARRLFIVSGRVQGVGFRWFVRYWGEKLGLRGWVSNRDDGTVATEAEGREDDVREFEKQLRMGPPGASVDSVETTVLKPEGGPAMFMIQ